MDGEQTLAWWNGHEAFLRKKKFQSNPHHGKAARSAWSAGYQHAQKRAATMLPAQGDEEGDETEATAKVRRA